MPCRMLHIYLYKEKKREKIIKINKFKEKKNITWQGDYFFHFVVGDTAIAWDISSLQDSREYVFTSICHIYF